MRTTIQNSTTGNDPVPTDAAGKPSWFAGGVPLKQLFPYPGGKARVTGLIWKRLGNVDNYLEHFAGTAVTLLQRPADHFTGGYRTETVNDANHFIVNLYRALQAQPDDVARHADWPVTEADLHARHQWLMRSEESAAFKELMRTDPLAFNTRIAGWWAWGQCCWIGGAWCEEDRIDYKAMPVSKQKGVAAWKAAQQIPEIADRHGRELCGRPQLADCGLGRVVHSNGNAPDRAGWLAEWCRRLRDRLRRVRVLYGDWRRVGDSPSTTTRLGVTGMMLDPPYRVKRADDGKKSRAGKLYSNDRNNDLDKLNDDVLDYCIKYGANPEIRIALCTYEGDGYERLADVHGWDCVAWETGGGYGNQSGKKSENAGRERIFFSPYCLKPENVTRSLF